MGLIKEFKDFAMRGNVMDMAVGVIIGGAFGKIVSSLVNDIIMPVVGAITGSDISQNFLWLGDGERPATLEEARATGEAFLAWGSFLQTVVDFAIIAACIFVMIKVMNKATEAVGLGDEEEAPAAPPEPPEDIVLLREIRDALKNS